MANIANLHQIVKKELDKLLILCLTPKSTKKFAAVKQSNQTLLHNKS